MQTEAPTVFGKYLVQILTARITGWRIPPYGLDQKLAKGFKTEPFRQLSLSQEVTRTGILRVIFTFIPFQLVVR